jgi:hypothetical protein
MTTIYLETLDDMIAEVAFESHREFHTRSNVETPAQPKKWLSGTDINGRTYPEIMEGVNSLTFQCGICGRPVVPHR